MAVEPIAFLPSAIPLQRAQYRTRMEGNSPTPGTLSSVPYVAERASDAVLARATDSISGAQRRTRIESPIAGMKDRSQPDLVRRAEEVDVRAPG
jgi:hypothetical protein